MSQGTPVFLLHHRLRAAEEKLQRARLAGRWRGCTYGRAADGRGGRGAPKLALSKMSINTTIILVPNYTPSLRRIILCCLDGATSFR